MRSATGSNQPPRREERRDDAGGTLSSADEGLPAAIAWATFQPRTIALARALGGEAVFVASNIPRHAALLPLRYLLCGVRTWQLLRRRRPRLALVITPPVLAPAVVWSWAGRRARPFVVDCHTDTFHDRRWRWAQPLLRRICRSARAVLVHTEEALEVLETWDVRGLMLPDDVPDGSEADRLPQHSRPTVLVAGGLNVDEPVAEVLEAARHVPEVEVRLTGDPRGVPTGLREGAPANVTFTGFLPYGRFLGEMVAADVVAVLSTDPHIMNRGAFEAAGLGRPLLLSDIPGLRQRFGMGARYVPNSPERIATAFRQALAETPVMAARSQELGAVLRRQRADALSRLKAMLQDVAD
jgi:glycosyltransferase involved in cell wall biosynthesis